MKVLWITNVELPAIANKRGKSVVVGGWMHQTLMRLKESMDIYVAACASENYGWIECEGVKYCGFTSKASIDVFEKMIKYINPNCIHIWGSEYDHSYYAVSAAKKLSKIECTILSIQGLVSIYAKHYCDGIPPKLIYKKSLKEILGKRNIAEEQRAMELQGKTETKTVELLKHCMGRTDWDYACAKQINPEIKYHYCGEILREGFYTQRWKYENCDKKVIFFSQAHYPIKGLHIMLGALKIVKKRYPSVILRVVGENPNEKPAYKKSTYDKYICDLIKKNNLLGSIEWLGKLSEENMIENYIRANVFVCASSIENSSNSIGEAMILGVPVVASDVGGIKSFLSHEKEGLIYHGTADYMLADNIIKIFESKELAIRLGNAAHERAKVFHNVNKNLQALSNIYDEIKLL